jgi:hypothetical protein
LSCTAFRRAGELLTKVELCVTVRRPSPDTASILRSRRNKAALSQLTEYSPVSAVHTDTHATARGAGLRLGTHVTLTLISLSHTGVGTGREKLDVEPCANSMRTQCVALKSVSARLVFPPFGTIHAPSGLHRKTCFIIGFAALPLEWNMQGRVPVSVYTHLPSLPRTSCSGSTPFRFKKSDAFESSASARVW